MQEAQGGRNAEGPAWTASAERLLLCLLFVCVFKHFLEKVDIAYETWSLLHTVSKCCNIELQPQPWCLGQGLTMSSSRALDSGSLASSPS